MKHTERAARHKRITRKLKGCKERPRLVVFRSKKHIYAQLVDDSSHRTIASCTTTSKEFSNFLKKGAVNIKSGNKNGAKELGKLIAQKAHELKIDQVSFDRAGYKYHGRVKALADGAKEGGLKF